MAALWPILTLLTSMCLEARAQSPDYSGAVPPGNLPDTITPLQIGDTIPDYLWHLPIQVVNHPDQKEIITLNDYKGKAILLDFLFTGCKGCIAALPVLEKISLAFDSEVGIVAVTPEKRQRVTDFIPSNSYVNKSQLPFIVEDRILKQHFPHLYISHVVWIDVQGIVRAFTGTKHVTTRTIRELQNGNTRNWPVKTEMTSFFNAPLVRLNPEANSMRNNVGRPLYYSAITGYTEGVGVLVPTKADSLLGIKRISFKNMPIIDLYRIAIGSEFPLRKQICWEVEHPERYAVWMATLDSGQTLEEWYQQNSICYEGTFPIATDEETWQAFLRADLNRFLNLNGRLEHREGETYFVLSELP